MSGGADGTNERDGDRASERTVERVDGGEWAVAAALTLAGVGLAVGSQVLVAAATLPLWYVAAAVFGGPTAATVRLERQLVVGDARDEGERRSGTAAAPDDPGDAAVSGDPGDAVAVRTTVQNAGSEPIVDLRVVDGVPDALPVVSGTPRTCVTLEPLETATIEYELSLRRGEHAFGDARVRTRDTTGTVTETWTAAVRGADAVRCSSAVETVPLEGGANDYAGEVPTDEGGSGVEFYSVRDYEPGDPVGSIDWRRYAATRELATVEYRAERATRIVCLVDARSSQFGAATTADRPAAELSADAAGRTFGALVDAGHPTGVAAIYDRTVDAVPPGTDPATRERATRALDVTDGVDQSSWFHRSRAGGLATEVVKTLPGEAQVYLFSSFVDDEPVDLAEGLRARGYAVRVVSPDVTGADDVATRLEALARANRLARARATGARVVDWDLDRSFGLVLHDAVGEVGSR